MSHGQVSSCAPHQRIPNYQIDLTSMPLTAASLVLRCRLRHRAPDVASTIVSDFLIPDVTLAEACQWSRAGSTSLLDLVWLRSLRDAESSAWSVAKLLQSEPHYYRWEFSQVMVHVVRRGDLAMLQWLLRHFSGCPVSHEVVEAATGGGHLWALQLLEADATHGGIQWCTGDLENGGESSEWRESCVEAAARGGNWCGGCFNEPEARGRREEQTTVEAQGRSDILRYLVDSGHVPVTSIGVVAVYRAARFGDLAFIKWLASKFMELIDIQYWICALENASEGGHLGVVQWIFTNVGGVIRGSGPTDAMFAAAENGKIDVVKWLYERFGAKNNVDLFQKRVIPPGVGNDGDLISDEDLIPTTAMDAAAKNGHLSA
ncbi:unnamed protein product [Phytophthora fragariaefolia]|uniref:Unnamed protein product n=1 Tax=Phytophthora fragariaefolia TaxID=1490495 RepID=A0A9W6U5L6_9STRA|nr:unnamed protein product [Phytophthora fragariaefolia]